jgi:hypothetical protein
MRPDKLKIHLRPRTHAQALDLGFALLHEQAGVAYRVWLALWLPLVLLAMLLSWWLPDYDLLWAVMPWWLRPLLERGPLYVLSRQVFGDSVGWREALRAWPGQLRGGALQLLTWGRPLAAARSLYQPIWMLEGARGGNAATRRRVIGRNGASRAAWLFGLACVNFEAVLQLGLLGGLSLFLSPSGSANPLYLLTAVDHRHTGGAFQLAMLCYGIGVGIVGPIYTAGGFTLYLNRRATLEAWDLEMVLRQIRPPARRTAEAAGALLLAAPVLLVGLLAALLLPSDARAAGAVATAPAPAVAASAPLGCQPPEFLIGPPRQAGHDAVQVALRSEVDRLYDTDTLRGYVCREHWRFKNNDQAQQGTPSSQPDLSAWALAIKATLIAGAVAGLAWLLYRYRGMLFAPELSRGAAPASEIGGLDIRPETLPADVAVATLQLWDAGKYRGALALLYRATLSRLVERDGLLLYRGATEGDCLRLAGLATRDGRLTEAKAALAATVTRFWLAGAYGGHWPGRAALAAACADWHAQFDGPQFYPRPGPSSNEAAETPT